MFTLSLLQEQARQRTSAALADAELHRTRRTIRAERRRSGDLTQVGSLLSAAAATPLDDVATWTTLRERAAEQTSGLARTGGLPSHLIVRPDDVPVVVARTIAAAWRHLLRTPDGIDRCTTPARGH